MAGLLVLLLIAAATWLMRVAFVVVLPAHRLPGWMLRGLEHLAPAVLAALVAMALVGSLRTPTAAPGGTFAVAGIGLSILAVAWRTQSLVWTAAAALIGVLVLDVVLV